jgi:hypothetical protein
MNKAFPLILKIFTCFIIAGTISLALVMSKSSGTDNGFTETLLKYIDIHERKTEGATVIQKTENNKSDRNIPLEQDTAGNTPLIYQNGDWDKYVISPRYSVIEGESGGKIYADSNEASMNTYGSYKLNAIYGKSSFTNNKYRMSDDDKPVSKIIKDGQEIERQMQLHMEGTMGRRMKVYIDYDSKKEDNQYVMQYRAKNNDEVIREINAGEIDIKLQGSKYAVYDDNSAKGLGMDIILQKNNLKVKAFGSVAKGETVVETFRGNSSSSYVKQGDYQYEKSTYFQLEPYRRYDGLTTAPSAGDNPYNSLITFTSNPSNPESYRPSNVEISSSGFVIYMDDQNPYNNTNSIKLGIDGSYYDLQVSGADYTINYSTGLITFLKAIPNKARIFAVYTLASGKPSSDPAVRTDVSSSSISFSGKNFVFIKYGTSINEDSDSDFILDPGEDKNGDERLNLDIYEVKSIYNIGQKQLSSDNFQISLYKQNSIVSKSDSIKIGKYKVDYTNGLIMFYLREPFKELYVESGETANATSIYAENQTDTVSTYSKYNLRVDYYKEVNSFQLKHTNIIPGSVRIKINGRIIVSSLYTVDYTSGYLQFTSPNNPSFSSETEMEIKYEYLPSGKKTSTLDTGVRVEYDINKNLKIGGTVLLSKNTGTETIPTTGNEPSQTLVLESDASLRINESSFKELIKNVIGYKAESIPVEVRAYGEYAKSIKNPNTFGKALVDNLESNENILSLSMSDKDWQLSSMPYNTTIGDISQTYRGLIYYYYYRNTSNPGVLKGIDFSPAAIDYAKKPGPYNIAMGHIDNSIQEQTSQKTLTFNFKFSGSAGVEEYIPVVTRKLSSNGTVDLSGLEYIEVWYKSAGGTGNVELYFDIGTLNEDADSNGISSTEDSNNNGVIDSGEDIGFPFTPSGGTSTIIGSGPGLTSFTTGDGLLNSEDLNGNGTLDTSESRIRLPGTMTTPYTNASTLSIDLSDTEWKSARIYLNKASSDYSSNSTSYEELLKSVQSVRLFLKKTSSSVASTGTIYIDSIKLVSTIWGNIMLNDVVKNSPTEFNLTLVDTINDSDYRTNSFLLQEKSVYKSLYGQMSDSELNLQKETAIQIDYNLSSVPNHKGSVTKTFTKPIDLRYYKTMNLWLNYRSFNAGDSVSIFVGSSDSNYIQYTFTMDYLNTWREMKLKLKSNSTGTVEKSSITGNPDLKRISFLRVEIYSTSAGKLWLDDIYLSEPVKQKDDAYWAEGELKITKPLFRTESGTPVFSDIVFGYINKGHGAQFSTIGQTATDIELKYSEIFFSANILPNWSTKLDYIVQNTSTDSLNELVAANERGNTVKNSLIFESNYISNINLMPTIRVSYKQDSYNNTIVEDSSTELKKNTINDIYTPSIILEEKINDFLYGNLLCTIKMDLYFKDEKIDRSDSSYATEYEKREKENLTVSINYQNKYFFIQPSVYTGSHEIVDYRGKTSLNDTRIANDFNGGFHFPMVLDDDSKLVDRQKKADFKIGTAGNSFFAPNLSLGYYYSENDFKDYSQSERLLTCEFSRSKDANSSLSNGLNLPFNFNNFGALKFIKSLNIYYTRSIYLEEASIPYESENTSAFDEKYGIDRIYNKFSGPAYNLFAYPPWYFFRGRGNFSHGRDFCYSSFNKQLKSSSDSAIQDYSNHLKLIDNAGFSSLLDLVILNMNFGGSINEVSERTALLGIPQEVVSINLNSSITFDLMQIFNFGFFRANKLGMPYHSANLNIGYTFARNMLITSNIEENTHNPNTALTFKRDRSSLALKSEFNYRQRNKREYISLNDSSRSSKDDIYISNMSTKESFKENDKGYKYSIFYETDVLWLHKWFSYFYMLTANPIFSIEYSLMLNRYDYSKTASPEPYDQHLITGKLILDLHKNIQGGLTGRAALEKYRNRETNHVIREIQSYEIAFNFSLLF